MDLDDLKTSFLRKTEEEKLDFIKNLRYNRTIDNSPPKKEKKVREKKDPTLSALSKLGLSKEEEQLLLSLIEEEKNGTGTNN